LKQLSDAGVELFWMAGNRDFLVGKKFAEATGARLLDDPYILKYANQSCLISHGDQLCTDDTAYQQFRSMVRQPEWQAAFLARPLAERKQIIAQMRMQSQQHQQQQSAMIMDVNQAAVDHFFAAHDAKVLIHGHTHRPALHNNGDTRRYVLSDWDCDHLPPRGDWLAMYADGSLHRYQLICRADGQIGLRQKNALFRAYTFLPLLYRLTAGIKK
jgi:UDP-2,3-diacylglucosamine hydrolase